MILVLNDLHFDQIGPVCRDSFYLKDLTAKMLEVAELSKGAQLVLCTGDIIHKKVGKNVSHFTIRVMMALLKRFKCPFMVVLGNHDLMGNQVRTTATQPIGVLLESGFMQRLDLNPILEGDLQIEGIPYSLKFEEGQKFYNVERKASTFILGLHSALSPGSLLRSNISGPTHCCIGHPHLNAGMTEENGIKFIEYGSLARITTRPYDKRAIEIALLEPTKKGLKIYSRELKRQRHWSRIYREVPETEEEIDIEGFVEALATESINSEKDLEEILNSLTQKVRARVDYYLQG